MKSLATLAIVTILPLAAQETRNDYLSVQNEARLAISRGNNWLAGQQHDDGHWGDPDLPAITALALAAAVRAPDYDPSKPMPDHLRKGFDWLLEQQEDNGGIYNKGLAVYNTAAAVTAMSLAGDQAFEPAIVKARKYLIGEQWDIGKPKETDNPNDGGIGYGSHDDRTDLSNTYLAIEALALSEKVVADGRHGDQPRLNWDAAVTFLSRCQNLEETNDQEWASDDPANRGGFIYNSQSSKAGEQELEDGRVALRSYGSMSYAGLLSMIYAELEPGDIRVEAVKDWLGRNYTLEENPGMGLQGLYYYYQTMAKALSVAGIDELKRDGGKPADWRRDLANALLTRQRENGSWVNSNGRWMESDPILVTSYSVLALGQICHSIPK